MNDKKAVMNWSGGKDSSFALYKIMQQKEYSIQYLLTSLNEESNRISMHGVRYELLKKQSESMGIPLKTFSISTSNSLDVYENKLRGVMDELKSKQIEYSVFGDIFLEDLRVYREQQSLKAGMKTVFPLWKIDTTKIIEDFLSLGFKAVVTAIDAEKLPKAFVGREINYDFINDLPDFVDPCGENGEFHSFVYDGPIFKRPIDFVIGDVVFKKYSPENPHGFYFCDLIP